MQPTTGAVAYNFVHVNDSGRASSNSNAGRSQVDGNLLANGQLYVSDPAQAAKLSTRHAQIDDELLAALERLDALS